MSSQLLQPESHLLSLADYLVKDQRNNTPRANQVAALYFPNAASQALQQAHLLVQIAHLIVNGPHSKDQIVALVTSSFSTGCIPTVLALAKRLAPTIMRVAASAVGVPVPHQAVARPDEAPPPQKEEHEDFEEHQANEKYDEYNSSKFFLGNDHPDPLIQSSSMAAVEAPDIDYQFFLPPEVKKVLYNKAKNLDLIKLIIANGLLSRPQLETVAYACQSHDQKLPGRDGQRRGFFLGDGAGVGKGRQIAGLMFENYLKGRVKALWVSISKDLQHDARRDLDDIGATTDKFPSIILDKMKCNDRIIQKNGVMFITYALLISKSTEKGKSRLDQVIKWLGNDFDGVVAFDECHKAKNLDGKPPSIMGTVVKELQDRLPDARVIYCSATGISEPSNMAYMTRLGLWGPGSPFPSGFEECKLAIEKGGIGMMELLAMHLKQQGVYMCRTLSLKGCTFNVIEDSVALNSLNIYDTAAVLWQDLLEELKLEFEVPSYYDRFNLNEGNVQEDSDDSDDDSSDDETMQTLKVPERNLKIVGQRDYEHEKKVQQAITRYLWGSHQSFFKSLCVSLKVDAAINITKKAIEENKSVIIGMQSTGGSLMAQSLATDDDPSDFIQSTAMILKRVRFRIFPIPEKPQTILLEEKIQREKDDLEALKKRNQHEMESCMNGQRKRKTAERSKRLKSSRVGDKWNQGGEDDDSDTSDDSAEIFSPDKEKNPVKGQIKKGSRSIVLSDEDDDDALEAVKVSSSSASSSSSSSMSLKRCGSRASGRISTQKVVSYTVDSDMEEEGEDSDDSDGIEIVKKKSTTSNKKKIIEIDSDDDFDLSDGDENMIIDGRDNKRSSLSLDIDENEGGTLSNKSAKLDMNGGGPSGKPRGLSGGLAGKAALDPSIEEEIVRVYREYKLKRDAFLEIVEGLNLPGNPLDTIIDKLGGEKKVAEMTGRKERLLRQKDGKVKLIKRSVNGISLASQNVHEKELFMQGKKRVAIISEAASAGISLHADRRVQNQEPRVHITIELAWSADKATQQLGRSHRSNQSSAPEYHLLIAPQGGEKRFAAAVAKRLESLGALTQGDRTAVGARTMSLSNYNFETKYGVRALRQVFESFCPRAGSYRGSHHSGQVQVDLPQLSDIRKEKTLNYLKSHPVLMYAMFPNTVPTTNLLHPQTVLETKDINFSIFGRLSMLTVGIDVTEGDKKKDSRSAPSSQVGKFLNRLLGLETETQNEIFSIFADVMSKIIRLAKRDNSFDSGIIELSGERVSLKSEGKRAYTPMTLEAAKQAEEAAKQAAIEEANPTPPAVKYEGAIVIKDEKIKSEKGWDQVNREDIKGSVVWYCVSKNRSVTWEEAIVHLKQATEEQDEFYERRQDIDRKYNNNANERSILSCMNKKVLSFYKTRNAFQGKYFIHLAVEKPCDNINQTSLPVNVICYRPLTGVFERSRYELEDKYIKTSIDDAKVQWESEFNDARDNNPEKMSFDYHVLGGAILPEWGFIERALNRTVNSDTSAPMRVARATILKVPPTQQSNSSSGDTEEVGEPISIIGLHIPSNKIEYILEALRSKEKEAAVKLLARATAAANFVDVGLGVNSHPNPNPNPNSNRLDAGLRVNSAVHNNGMGLQHRNVIGSMNNIADGVDGGNVEEVKRELNQGDVV